MEHDNFAERHRLLMGFKNKELEKEFKLFYELETRGYIRTGIIMSMFAWAACCVLTYFIANQYFLYTSSVILLATYPYFIFIIYATYHDQFIGYYQIMASVANGIAGLLILFWIPYLLEPTDEYGVLSGILAILMIILFFAFYILRLRFFPAVGASIVYFGIYQYQLLSSSLEKNQIIPLMFGAWIALVFAYIAVYVLELTSRKIFIQQKVISEQQKQIIVEQERAENLLLNILPDSIAQRLKTQPCVIADNFNDVSVLFADIVNFTPMSAKMTPVELVELLNDVFSYFDELVEKYEVEKIKTIGDCYMVAAGVPHPQSDHAKILAQMALEIQNYFSSQKINGKMIDFRIGINSGSVVAGVIGRKKFAYDLWGDVVNTASRMESQGISGRIQITEPTYELVKDEFFCEPSEEVPVKGKGEMKVWHIIGAHV
jgi:class 3 adenylate cyclase